MNNQTIVCCLVVMTAFVSIICFFVLEKYSQEFLRFFPPTLMQTKEVVIELFDGNNLMKHVTDPMTTTEALPQTTRIPTTRKKEISIDVVQKLRTMGFESTTFHDFKSIYIINATFYDTNSSIHKVKGVRKTKVLSCFNCPRWFTIDPRVKYNRNFQECPYNECFFDSRGIHSTSADVLLFFPVPRSFPPRPKGQIWAYCSWESPVHYSYPSPYAKWSDVFNWTIDFRQDADIFAPYNLLAWRAKETLMSYSEYLKIAKSKTKTAAWIVSNCNSQSKRWEYVKRMKKIIDIDIYGRCSKQKCVGIECLRMLNNTYKFYLSFENSFCKDYVTEKLFRNFDHRLQIIPVVRGGFDYEKYVPPNMIVDASKFDSPEALAEDLKKLRDDVPRYTAMLQEKDKLASLNYKYYWCTMCERLHKGEKPKTIKDIKKLTHYTGVCWTPKF